LQRSKAGSFFGLGRAHPGVHCLLQGDAIHRLEHGRQPERDHGGYGREAAHPAQPTSRKVQGVDEGDQADQDDGSGDELPQVDGGPGRTRRVLGEHGRVVIGRLAAGVQQANQRHELADQQQRGRQAKRLTI
jgi:hypothetical protein